MSMASLPETHITLNSWGQTSLQRCLEFLGLLRPKTTNLYHRIAAIVVLILSTVAVIYETIIHITVLSQQVRTNDQFATIIDKSQYIVEPTCTLIILLLFWRKSSAISGIMKEVSVLSYSKSPNENTKENGTAGMVSVVFVLYIAATTGILLR